MVLTLRDYQTKQTNLTCEVLAPVKVAAAVAVTVVLAADEAVADIAVGHSEKTTFFRAGTEQRVSFPEILTNCGSTRWLAFV